MEWGVRASSGLPAPQTYHHTWVTRHKVTRLPGVMHTPGNLFQSSLTCKAPRVSDL